MKPRSYIDHPPPPESFKEAPLDGNLYGRKNADWESIPAGGSLIVEPWTPLIFQAGFSGSASARSLKAMGDPAIQMIQLRGQFTADVPWGTGASVFAMLPPEIRPTSSHYLIFPSSSTSTPDSISSLVMSPNGQLVIHLTSTPDNPPTRGWVDGLTAA